MNLVHISSESAIGSPVRKAQAWKIVSDFPKFPSYCRSIDKISILSKVGTEQVSEWDVTFDGAPLSWIQKDTLDQNSYSVKFRALSGDFEQLSGSLCIKEASEGNTAVVYSASYNVGIPVIEELFGPVFRNKMQLNFNAIANGIAGEIGKLKISSDERSERRHKIGVRETIAFDGMGIEVKIEDISARGMLFTCDKFLEKPVSAKVCGLDLAARELHYEAFDKKYRLVFDNAMAEEQLMAVVKKLQSRHVRTMGNLFVMEPSEALYSQTSIER